MATETTTPPIPRHPNLRPAAPFQKGRSGNPAGRPKGSLDRRSFRRLIEDVDPEAKMKIIARLVRLARQGSIRAAEVLMKYGDMPANFQIETREFTLTLDAQGEDQDALNPGDE